jgi:hypothetical protein
MSKEQRVFDTGAMRDKEDGKYNYHGFLHPKVLQEFARYMDHHRRLPDGSLREASNWKKGMPIDSYMESLLRHVMDLWLLHDGYEVTRPETGDVVTIHDALGGIFFNCQGYWAAHLNIPQSPQEPLAPLDSPTIVVGHPGSYKPPRRPQEPDGQ